MITYKLFRIKKGKLYPLYVDANTEMEIGKWLYAKVGERADDTHVKSRLGSLSLKPGFHSTSVTFTDWIGKKEKDETLSQKKNTVWCECEIEGNDIGEITGRVGLRDIPNGYYRFKTNSKQTDPWFISDKIFIRRILSNEEVAEICRSKGIEPQRVAV